jgi:lysophospholipase L1-like esterase
VKILLAGSSHTRFFFPYVKDALKGVALVTKLPQDAGRTDEILNSLPAWPLEAQDVVHIYSGHRDLAPGPDGKPHVERGQYGRNLEKIVQEVLLRTSAKIVLSNIPPVSDGFLETDPDRNGRIEAYNAVIGEVAKETAIPVHDFREFILSGAGGAEKYVDGLHFTRRVYRDYGRVLANYLVGHRGCRGCAASGRGQEVQGSIIDPCRA